ncbi:hypothetical protein RDV77_04150 [Porphyromonadaceae sp. NP-X]|nr:hypothetical protein [Porphyromonadaceae sp. NP-X]
MLKETLQNIERLQGLMVAYVTNGRTDDQPKEYKSVYIDTLINLEKLGYENPNKFKTLEEFWGVCKLRFSTYAERRAFVNEIYGDICLDIERKLRQEPEPKEWLKTNDVLTDELAPIRRQWLKAKNFLLSGKPDFENCIKEATNSIESALQILLGQPGETLGKAIKLADIDSDIKKLISQMYGLVSNKDFVRHGGTIEQDITKADAEYFLNFSAISIQYLKQRLKK